ncbi:MAG: 16S rRNA (uracil(1498)-N(3))-methyltransferase [Venatoribacter sp.]
MSVRLYQPLNLALGQTYPLDDDNANYLLRVLRMQEGNELQVFDGKGKEYLAELVQVQKKSARFLVKTLLKDEAKPLLNLHLGQVISKGERMDFTIQKATELGISEITPLWSERCDVRLNNERQDKKREHWQAVAISACQQSGRTHVPIIHPPMALADWLTSINSDIRLVLHPHQQQPWQAMPAPKSVALLVGPEGGFTEQEVQQAQQQHFMGLRLGPRILRTETAALTALSVLQYQWGDFR